MRLLPAFLLAVVTPWATLWGGGPSFYISTFAGGGLPIYIPGTSASLYGPVAVAVDRNGNVFFVDNNVVLRLDAVTNILTLAAGNGTPGFSGDNGSAASAQLNKPEGIALDTSGNLYIADNGNSRVRKVSSGVITTVAGSGTTCCTNLGDNGPATSAQFNQIRGLAVDSSGNIYIADAGNNRIRKVSNGVITTVAGGAQGTGNGDNGPATSAVLSYPVAVAVDSSGKLYIAEELAADIREVSGGTITTVTGGGSVPLSEPFGLAVDSSGNLYIADTGNSLIRKVATASGGVVTTVAGGGSSFGESAPPTMAQLSAPEGVAVDSAGNLYIADFGNARIRKVANGVITTIGGTGTQGFSGDNGPAPNAQLGGRSDIAFGLGPVALPAVAVDSSGSVYIADALNNRIRKVTKGIITTVAGNGTAGFFGDSGPATSAQLKGPTGVAVDSSGNLYIADTQNARIRKVSGGVITTVAGSGAQDYGGDGGPAISASLSYPTGVALDSAGNLYIADDINNVIRKVTNGVISTVAGNGSAGYTGDNGPAVNAQLDGPFGIALDSAGNLYITDSLNCVVRKVTSGVITTVAGNGTRGFTGDNGPATSAELAGPQGIAVDSAGNIYIADGANNRIREVSGGVIATIAGTATQGYGGDGGPAASAELNDPVGLAVDSTGDLYVADFGNFRVRLLTANPVPTINQDGIVPVYSAVPTVQSGSWVSIYGSNLASGYFLWNGDFPTSLGNVTVTIDNKPGYLWVVSPTQINFQVPDDSTTGAVSVVVTTPTATAVSSVTLAPYGPSFSLLGDNLHVVGEIAVPNGTGAYGSGVYSYDLVGPTGAFSFSTRPVNPGETLTLFGVGFGPTTPVVPAGHVFSGVANTNTPVAITIGGVTANVVFSGITEEGLYQFDLTVPNVPAGDLPIQATVNGAQTPLGPVVSVQ